MQTVASLLHELADDCVNTVFGEMVNPDDYTGGNSLPILLDDVKCGGSEASLLSCPQLPLNAGHDCTHREDVAISCTGEPPPFLLCFFICF